MALLPETPGQRISDLCNGNHITQKELAERIQPDGSLYRMTLTQRTQASALIRRECCNCDGGNCLVLDDGDTCICLLPAARRCLCLSG